MSKPLLGEGLGDVGRRDRAVERAGLADLAPDDDLDAAQPRRKLLCGAVLSTLQGVELHALALATCFRLPGVAMSASLRGSR